jgi:hypothetical protein
MNLRSDRSNFLGVFQCLTNGPCFVVFVPHRFDRRKPLAPKPRRYFSGRHATGVYQPILYQEFVH